MSKHSTKGYDQGIAGAISSVPRGTWLPLDWRLMDRQLSIKRRAIKIREQYDDNYRGW